MNTSPPPNPTKTLSTKLGLRERMSTAQSVEELLQLFDQTKTFKSASAKTIRQWNKVFTERKQYLSHL